jgi:hypothetical protein
MRAARKVCYWAVRRVVAWDAPTAAMKAAWKDAETAVNWEKQMAGLTAAL